MKPVRCSARILLGLAEGGLLPGIVFYLSLWYKRSEQGRRVAIFYSAVIVAMAFSGIFAFAVESLGGRAGLPGWAWIVSIDIPPVKSRLTPLFSSSSKVS
jgi:MFS family permease